MHHLLLKKITKTLGLGWFGVVYSWSLCILAIINVGLTDSLVDMMIKHQSLVPGLIHVRFLGIRLTNAISVDYRVPYITQQYVCRPGRDFLWSL
jgi:hypothetical protein